MWFTLDPAKTIENFSKIGTSSKGASVIFDVPSNMEVLLHESNNIIQIKFFYYAGGTETLKQQVLNYAVAETGKSSKRLFSISGKSINEILSGIEELILETSKARTECNLQACIRAITFNRNRFTDIENHVSVEMSPGKKIEKILSMANEETIDYIQGLLESSVNLGFDNVQQLIHVIEMYQTKK